MRTNPGAIVLAVLLAGVVANGSNCPCRVYHEPMHDLDIHPDWQLVKANEEETVWEIDGSKPVWLRHGMIGLCQGFFDGMDDGAICDWMVTSQSVRLWINGQEVAPSFYAIRLIAGDDEDAAAGCPARWSWGPVFEIPAGSLQAGIHVFSAHWWWDPSEFALGLGPDDFNIPEVARLLELGTISHGHSTTVVVSYP